MKQNKNTNPYLLIHEFSPPTNEFILLKNMLMEEIQHLLYIWT